jgi:hypothetical protein
MLQANVLRVGCSLVEHWLFDSSWLIPDASTAHLFGVGFRKSIGRMGWGGSSTLLGPEETGTRAVLSGVGCLQVAFEPVSPWLVGWVQACGPVLPSYRIRTLVFPELFLGWGWGGLVVVWVGVRSCFENCIVNASIL